MKLIAKFASGVAGAFVSFMWAVLLADPALADPATLTLLSTVATVVGTGVTAAGTIAAGNMANKAATYEGAQLDIKGKEEQAAAQREAEQMRRRRDLALSALTARSAASGFSATSPTVLNLGEDIAEFGTYQEDMARYGGEARRAGLEAQAEGVRYTGRARRAGSYWQAAGTVLSGVSSLANKYNPPAAAPGQSAVDQYYPGGGIRSGPVKASPAYG